MRLSPVAIPDPVLSEVFGRMMTRLAHDAPPAMVAAKQVARALASFGDDARAVCGLRGGVLPVELKRAVRGAAGLKLRRRLGVDLPLWSVSSRGIIPAP